MTPLELDTELDRLMNRLEGKSEAYAILARDAAVAEVDYKIEYAKALLTSDKKTVAEREADALIQCEDYYRARKINEAVASACLEAMRSIRDQISAVQSQLRHVAHLAGDRF